MRQSYEYLHGPGAAAQALGDLQHAIKRALTILQSACLRENKSPARHNSWLCSYTTTHLMPRAPSQGFDTALDDGSRNETAPWRGGHMDKMDRQQ